MPLVTGLTSTLPKPFSLFFWEYDDTPLTDVLEDARFLAKAFDMEIYVIESSPNNYHLISFDILTLEQVYRVQCWTLGDGDYLDVKMSALFDGFINRQWNALRLSEKATKPKPRYITRFTHGHNFKSLKHFRFYSSYVKLPEPTKAQKPLYIVYGKVQITVYNTGIGSKPKPFSLGDHLLALAERKRLKKSLNT